MSANTLLHGGNLEYIEKTYNIKKEDIVDFSANVNPLGCPLSVKKSVIDNIDKISAYPDPNYLKLRLSISRYIGVSSDYITVGNGSTELISLTIRLIKPKKTVIVSPAYSEYEREARLAGSEISLFPLREKDNFVMNIEKLLETADSSTDLIVICNPNNPTGSAICAEEILKLLKHCKNNSTFVMIDETYVEFTDESMSISAMPLIKDFDNLFVIRGVSKFFALPGLRLGYMALSNLAVLQDIGKLKDPWSVNILAAIAGEAIFDDNEFISATKKLISGERTKIINVLSTFQNIKLYDTKSNFILFKIINEKIDSYNTFRELIKYNLVIRDASDFAFLGGSFLRFCFLLPEQNDFLIDRLRNIIG